jgi:hypothetical protein
MNEPKACTILDSRDRLTEQVIQQAQRQLELFKKQGRTGGAWAWTFSLPL